jgi:hypothetical protein
MKRCFAMSIALILTGFFAPSVWAEVTTSGSSPTTAGITGYRGDDISRERELSRGKGVIKLSLREQKDRACALEIEGKRVGLNADFEREQADRCSGSGTTGTSTSARFGYYITSVAVCTASRQPRSVQGFEIETVKVTRRGVSEETASNRSYTSHCDRWHRPTRCPTGSVMTGMVAHFAEIQGGADVLTGLQALCRHVTSD